MAHSVEVSEGGAIVIPAHLLEAEGIKSGDIVAMEPHDTESFLVRALGPDEIVSTEGV